MGALRKTDVKAVAVSPARLKLVDRQIKKPEEMTLPEIVSEVRSLESKGIEQTVRKGCLLLGARAKHFRGKDENWLTWIERTMQYSDQTARNWIALYEFSAKSESNSKLVLSSRNLTDAYVRAGVISRPAKNDDVPPPLKTGGGKSGTMPAGKTSKIPTPKIVWRKTSGAASALILTGTDPRLQIGRLMADPRFEEALRKGLLLLWNEVAA